MRFLFILAALLVALSSSSCTSADAARLRLGGGSDVAATFPTADAGADAQQDTLAQLSLDGSSSSGYDSLSWTLIGKPAKSAKTINSATDLTDATTTTPDFTPDVPGDYVFRLVATDNDGDAGSASTAEDTVEVQVGNDEGMILVDLSTGDLTDTNSLIVGGSTTWGTTSTVGIDQEVTATTNGMAFVAVQVDASLPADVQGIRVAIEATPPGTNPNTTGRFIVAAGVSTADPPAGTTHGARAGLAMRSNDDFEALEARAWGGSNAYGAVLTGDGYADVTVSFDGTNWSGLVWSAEGATTGETGGDASSLSGAVGAVEIVFAAGQTSSSGKVAGTSQWTNVKVWYQYLYGAAS